MYVEDETEVEGPDIVMLNTPCVKISCNGRTLCMKLIINLMMTKKKNG